jgi:ferredoxin
LKKAIINVGCVGCGSCVGVCPVVFQLGDDGTAKVVNEIDEHYDQVMQAVEGCPASVITLADNE